MIEPRSNLSHEGVDKREAPEFFPALDGLRAMAAFFVLLTHAGFLTATYSLGAVGAVLARMDIGVAIFFCLSGFLLSRPYLAAELSQRPRPSLRRYGWHRAIRILPAYWVALTVVLLTLARGVPADVLMSNVTLTQVYTNDELPGFTQTWSLCTEVAFYALLPLIAPWIFRSAARSTTMLAIRLCCIGGIAFFWIVAVVGDFLPLGAYAAQWLPGHLDWFAAGMLIAVAERVIAESSRLLDTFATCCNHQDPCWHWLSGCGGLSARRSADRFTWNQRRRGRPFSRKPSMPLLLLPSSRRSPSAQRGAPSSLPLPIG